MSNPLPQLGPRPRAPPFLLKTSSPTTLNEAIISPTTLINIQDFDGEGDEWTITAPCAKVTCFNSKNFTLRLHNRIRTSTVELWGSSNVRLFVGAAEGTSASDASPLGTLQLDPTLEDIAIYFAHENLVGSVVLAPSRGGANFGLQSVSLVVQGDESPFWVADASGHLRQPQPPRTVLRPGMGMDVLPEQWVLRRVADGKWESTELGRSEKAYPVLAKP